MSTRATRGWTVPATIVGLIFVPASGAAFNSYPVGAPHDQITRAACAEVGWSGATVGELCAAVRRADRSESRWAPGLAPWAWLRFRANAAYRPAHHFDRPPGMSSAEAFAHGAAYVREQTESAGVAMREGRREEAIVATGRAAHALQDLYAHSNLVDLPDDTRERIEAAVWDPAAAPPAALQLTGYDAGARDPERPEGDDYSHGEKSKDSAGKNAESRSRIGDESRFSRARRLATRATERLFLRLPWEELQQGGDPGR